MSEWQWFSVSGRKGFSVSGLGGARFYGIINKRLLNPKALYQSNMQRCNLPHRKNLKSRHMKPMIHQRKEKSGIGASKKLFILSAAVIASSLIATKSYSQVYFGARVGVRVPVPHVYVGATYAAPAPAPEYEQEPVYAPAPAPAYDGGYYAAPDVCEAEYPGYAYYDYPAWYGHYRDRVYFEHYRPFFYREHAAYFYHGGFDHGRFEHDFAHTHGFGYRGGSGYHGGGYGYHNGGHGGYHGRRW
jgi:hypothetical protein